MGEKSVQKKKFILETARKVFVEKGFKNVTMKDIVEACEISRGGLYLYFDNTAQIFLEVLKLESEETDDVFSDKITEDATAADILVLFLQEQKEELLRRQNTLTEAVYEYYFENHPTKKDNVLKKQFDSAEYGGALLLGSRSPVIKAHGSSDAKAFYNAIRQAISCCENNIIGEIETQLAAQTEEN